MCYKAYPLGVFVITPGLYRWWWSRNSTHSWAASSALLVLLEKQLLRNLVRFFILPCPPSQHCWASEYLQDCSLFVDGYLYMAHENIKLQEKHISVATVQTRNSALPKAAALYWMDFGVRASHIQSWKSVVPTTKFTFQICCFKNFWVIHCHQLS